MFGTNYMEDLLNKIFKTAPSLISFFTKKTGFLRYFLKFLVASIIIVLQINSITAQSITGSYNIQSFNTTNGLPSIQCFDIVQDHKGFIWVGTSAGLFRYDGKNSKVFTINEGLNDNSVRALSIDETGTIWIGTNQGLCFYDKGKINHTPFTKNGIDYIYAKDKKIWIFLRTGEIWLYENNIPVLKYNAPGRFANFPQVLGSNLIILQVPSTVVYIENQTCRAIRIEDTIVNRCIQILNEDNISFSSNKRLIKINKNLHITYEGFNFYKLINFYGRPTLFLGSTNHVNFFSESTGQNIRLLKEKDNKIDTLIVNGTIPGIFLGFTKLFADKEKNIWILDYGGLIKLSPANSIFYKQDTYHFAKGFSINLYNVAKGVDALYFVGPGYITKQKNNLIYPLYDNTGSNSHFNFKIQLGEVTSICADGKKGLWVTSTIKGLCYYNFSDKKITQIHLVNKDLPGYIINNIYRDKDSSLWLCGSPGLTHIINNKPIVYKGDRRFEISNINLCYRDTYGLLWISADNSLYTFNGNTFDQVASTFGINSLVSGITEDAEKNIYIATKGNGLKIISRIENKYKLRASYDKNQGILGGSALDVAVDKENKCWVVTLEGVSVIINAVSSHPYRVINYKPSSLVSNNVNNNNFWWGARLCVDDNNEVWLAANIGVVRFLNQMIKEETGELPTNIIELRIRNEELMPDSNKEYTFSYKTSPIEIQFRGITHIADGEVDYEYKLEGGTNNNWSLPTRNDRITFDNLVPGKYTFLVRSKLSSGIQWSAKPAVFSFIILPPWWQTTLFYFFYSVALLLIIGLIIVLTIKRNQQKLIREKLALTNDIKVLQAQLNPHFLFNSLASFTELIYRDPTKAELYIENLSGLSRYILINKDRELTTLKEELSFLYDYIQLIKLKFGEAVKINVSISPTEENKKIVPIVTQLLVENCLKHNIATSESPLSINIYTHDNCLIVENNINEKESKEFSTNIGLPVIKKKYALLTPETIKIYNKNDNFIICVPLLD
ncbi:hypothetical protein BH09BAC2_BH09BAC2_16360 [soil metagenome]